MDIGKHFCIERKLATLPDAQLLELVHRCRIYLLVLCSADTRPDFRCVFAHSPNIVLVLFVLFVFEMHPEMRRECLYLDRFVQFVPHGPFFRIGCVIVERKREYAVDGKVYVPIPSDVIDEIKII